jgi:hypothetical protein
LLSSSLPFPAGGEDPRHLEIQENAQMAVGFFFFLDMLLSLLLLRIYFTTGQFVWVSSFSLFQVGGGLTKELLEVGFLSRLCCCYWLARS